MIATSPAARIDVHPRSHNGYLRVSCQSRSSRTRKPTSRSSMPTRLPSTFFLLCVLFLFVSVVHGFNLDRPNGDTPLKRAILPPSTIAHKSLKTERAWSMPRAFDTSLGSNFTSPSCPQFFHQFLSEPKFIKCAAVSLMLQTSASFFDDTKSKATINRVLDTACAVPLKECSTLMASLAHQILRPSTCLADYSARNPAVVQAHSGLVAYDAVRQATCLRDPAPASQGGGGFCFASAVTNASAPTSSYVYYLPLGVALPADAVPACNICLWQTMRDFAVHATHAGQPIALTYPNAAARLNNLCGPAFARSNVRVVSNGAASARSVAASSAWLVVALLGAFLLLF